MTTKQKRAIGYSIRAKTKKKREDFIIAKEGSLKEFERSKYKSLYWYILAKYNTRIY